MHECPYCGNNTLDYVPNTHYTYKCTSCRYKVTVPVPIENVTPSQGSNGN